MRSMGNHRTKSMRTDCEGADSNVPTKKGSRAVVGVNAKGTSIHASSSVWAANTGYYVDFLMRDTRVSKQDASYHSTASTFGHGDQAVEVSMHFPAEGVLRVVNGNEKVSMAQPKGLVFNVNHLVLKMLTK